MTDFFNIISNFGFPIAIASYLLFRFEKKLELLEKANNELSAEVRSLKNIIANGSKEIIELKKTIVGLRSKK